jgi:hypothetical protein
MQLGDKPPVGIFFDSDMGVRIDSVLALALLYGLEGKSEARVIGLGVSISNLAAAQFCEVVGRFYAKRSKFLRGLPVGLAAGASPGDIHALEPAIANSGITPNIHTVNDTADPRILLRNALTAQDDGNAVVVCVGRETNLAAALELEGARDLIARKVRFLVTSIPVAEWPTPIIAAGPEAGSDILFPAAAIENDFTAPHPIADAYNAYQPMPYDAPTAGMAAMLYAARPDGGYFNVAERKLIVAPGQKDRILKTYIELASAKPAERSPKKG